MLQALGVSGWDSISSGMCLECRDCSGETPWSSRREKKWTFQRKKKEIFALWLFRVGFSGPVIFFFNFFLPWWEEIPHSQLRVNTCFFLLLLWQLWILPFCFSWNPWLSFRGFPSSSPARFRCHWINDIFRNSGSLPASMPAPRKSGGAGICCFLTLVFFSLWDKSQNLSSHPKSILALREFWESPAFPQGWRNKFLFASGKHVKGT